MDKEQRRSTRIRIDHEFHACSYDGENIPGIEAFFPVEAHDISRDGIALITDSFDVGDRILLMLGPPNGKLTMVIAEVVRVSAMKFGAVYRPVTGCEFTERLGQDLIDSYQKEAAKVDG